jgi:hypothetical protein
MRQPAAVGSSRDSFPAKDTIPMIDPASASTVPMAIGTKMMAIAVPMLEKEGRMTITKMMKV